jgi:hypothetical protein
VVAGGPATYLPIGSRPPRTERQEMHGSARPERHICARAARRHRFADSALRFSADSIVDTVPLSEFVFTSIVDSAAALGDEGGLAVRRYCHCGRGRADCDVVGVLGPGLHVDRRHGAATELVRKAVLPSGVTAAATTTRALGEPVARELCQASLENRVASHGARDANTRCSTRLREPCVQGRALGGSGRREAAWQDRGLPAFPRQA